MATLLERWHPSNSLLRIDLLELNCLYKPNIIYIYKILKFQPKSIHIADSGSIVCYFV